MKLYIVFPLRQHLSLGAHRIEPLTSILGDESPIALGQSGELLGFEIGQIFVKATMSLDFNQLGMQVSIGAIIQRANMCSRRRLSALLCVEEDGKNLPLHPLKQQQGRLAVSEDGEVLIGLCLVNRQGRPDISILENVPISVNQELQN